MLGTHWEHTVNNRNTNFFDNLPPFSSKGKMMVSLGEPAPTLVLAQDETA
jgi:hypothetical protein